MNGWAEYLNFEAMEGIVKFIIEFFQDINKRKRQGKTEKFSIPTNSYSAKKQNFLVFKIKEPELQTKFLQFFTLILYLSILDCTAKNCFSFLPKIIALSNQPLKSQFIFKKVIIYYSFPKIWGKYFVFVLLINSFPIQLRWVTVGL